MSRKTIDIDCTLERHEMPCEGAITLSESLAVEKELI
jgi:hypothetical protein